MEYMYLQGADDVLRAASAMRESANDMNRAADNFNSSVAFLENVLSDFLYEFQNILENKNIK